MAKRGLGKGLQALIPSGIAQSTGDSGNEVIKIKVDDIIPNVNQPRKSFDPDKIRELSESIKEHGILQPIVVREIENNKYEIVVGERRWRASKLVDIKEIPCIIRKFSNKDVTELALIENIQRENLNALEEAEALQRLLKEFDYTQDNLAGRLGKSRSYVANTLRLLNLVPSLQSFVREGLLSPGHARAILSVNDSKKHLSFAEKIINNKLSVRQSEEVAKELNREDDEIGLKNKENRNELEDKNEKGRIPPEVRDIENRLRNFLGTKVKIKALEKGGRIEIDFYSDDDLERIIEAMKLCC